MSSWNPAGELHSYGPITYTYLSCVPVFLSIQNEDNGRDIKTWSEQMVFIFLHILKKKKSIWLYAKQLLNDG